MKRHVNETTFQSGLRFQTGLSSLRVSRKCALKFCVFRKGIILPKREDRFFTEREDLPLLELTAETGLWYRLFLSSFEMKEYLLPHFMLEERGFRF